MKRIFVKIAVVIAVIALFIWIVSLFAGKKPARIQYGVTFSIQYAKSLGIDWKKAYTAMFTELQVTKVRLPVYWEEVEPTKDSFNFDELDYAVTTASQHNAQIILAVGKRLPRWPECHVPDWAQTLSVTDAQTRQLLYMKTVVQRYKTNRAIIMWQVENEAFLNTFGPCPKLDGSFLDQEISLVKDLDPSRPVLITDSGELSSWLFAGRKGDVFGSTYYRYIYSDVLKRYWTNFYFPSWFYRFKAGLVRIFNHGKPVMIAELEAEPWTTGGILTTSFDDQFKTMSLDHFQSIVSLASKTGFSPQYLWGVEWWYYMKDHGHPEFWQAAQKVFKN